MGFRRPALAYRPHLFSSLELDRDLAEVETQGLRQLLADRLPVILELGALENHRGIYVHDYIALGGNQVPGVPQELGAVGVFPAGIGIGEMHPNIAQRRGAQKGIGDSMRKNVRIRVSFEAELAGNGDAAEDQGPARRDTMDIPALADSDKTQDGTLAAISSARNSRARSISDGLVILMLRSLPEITLTST
jgi:hypothetical protein